MMDNKQPTVEQVRKLKQDLEDEIAMQIENFYDNTGLRVTDIDLIVVEDMRGVPVHQGIRITVRI